MARKRMLAASFWSDEKIGECTMLERLLFLGLISNADDEGLGRANPKLLMSLIFPYDDIRISDFKKSLDKLSSLGMVVLYSSNGQNYYHVKNFKKHQTINRPTPSDLPKPTGNDKENEIKKDVYSSLHEDSLSTHGGLTECSVLREDKLREDKRSEDSIYCAEPKSEESLSAPRCILPLAGGETFPVYERDFEKYASLYPAVDIPQAFRSMIGWLDSNPQKRKTKNGIKRFITGWLDRDQNRGGNTVRSLMGDVSQDGERLAFDLNEIYETPDA